MAEPRVRIYEDLDPVSSHFRERNKNFNIIKKLSLLIVLGKFTQIPNENVIGTIRCEEQIATGSGHYNDGRDWAVANVIYYAYLLIFTTHRIIGYRTTPPIIFAVNEDNVNLSGINKVNFEANYDKVKEIEVKMATTKTLKVFTSPPHIHINAGMFHKLQLLLSDEIMEETKKFLQKTPVVSKLKLT